MNTIHTVFLKLDNQKIKYLCRLVTEWNATLRKNEKNLDFVQHDRLVTDIESLVNVISEDMFKRMDFYRGYKTNHEHKITGSAKDLGEH